MQVALVSPDATYRELDELGRALSDDLETLPGVRRSEVFALPEPEVRIAVDLERMGRAGISLGQVEAAVRGENASIPGGSVDLGLRKFNLKTSGSYDSLDEIARHGRRRAATAAWSGCATSPRSRWDTSRAALHRPLQRPARDLRDRERQGPRRRLRRAQRPSTAASTRFEAHLPPNVRLERGFDQTRNVEHRLDRLGIDFAIAIGLVLLTLLPLGLRAAGVVMISIPLSLAIGLAALYFTGFSLNQLSIAGFVLALGLLVDDSIVVVENIARYLRAGYSRVEAAIAATDQIALAVRRLHRDAAVRVPAAAVPARRRRHLHPLAAGGGAVHRGRVAARLADDHPVPREPHAAGRGPRRARATGRCRRLMRVIHGIYGPALRVALGRAEAHAARGAGLRARVRSA